MKMRFLLPLALAAAGLAPASAAGFSLSPQVGAFTPDGQLYAFGFGLAARAQIAGGFGVQARGDLNLAPDGSIVDLNVGPYYRFDLGDSDVRFGMAVGDLIVTSGGTISGLTFGATLGSTWWLTDNVGIAEDLYLMDFTPTSRLLFTFGLGLDVRF
ncbi:MAG TPA: hypothetical protein VHN99_08155 [Deinococcales bacterium]|nr:hypothetical protein [Deinococcales bacterium]